MYCTFCTRSYAVGSNTDSVKKSAIATTLSDWEKFFKYIEANPGISDAVVSGGDTYFLRPRHLARIGDRLLDIPHVKRIRFGTRGLAVCPMRVSDESDEWVEALIKLSDRARAMGKGKQVALHTHFDHANEITWVTEQAALSLHRRGLIMRNQTVLLRGVNDNVAAMSTLIRTLADMNIQPYYVYQADMVQGTEHLRTPLSTILELQKQIRGTIAGFMTPQFVVDLPKGGGKRLASDYETYDRTTGVSTFRAPGVKGDRVFEYHDPVDSNDRS